MLRIVELEETVLPSVPPLKETKSTKSAEALFKIKRSRSICKCCIVIFKIFNNND